VSLYLRRLELAGFKSFADRTRLDFEPGVSAIVGPNGSGKSNIAEAIRWVLGERAGRALRTASTDNLIFAGMEKVKAAASMAEVTLTLEGKGDKVAERLIISRKLYRSGESEYRLNGRKALARDIAKLLAQAGFGTSSYTVIGQGMVEGLIIASPAERKLLFEEASGIRAFELERSQTMVKLRQAETQIGVLRQEARDIAPERDRLKEQVDRLARRRETSRELQVLRQQFIYGELNQIQTDTRTLLEQKREVLSQQKELRTRAKLLDKRASQLAEERDRALARHQEALRTLESLQDSRNQLSDQIAEQQIKLGVLSAAQTETDQTQEDRSERKQQVVKRLQDLHGQLDVQTKAADAQASKIELHNQKVRELTRQLTKLRHALKSNQLSDHLGQALGLVKLLLQQLGANEPIQRDRLRLVLHKLIRTVKLAHDADLSAAPEKIVKLQQQISREMSRREDVVEKQTSEIIKQRSLELDIHTLERELERLELKSNDSNALPERFEVIRLERALKSLLDKRSKLDAEHEAARKLLTELGGDSMADQVELAREQEEIRGHQFQLERELESLEARAKELGQRDLEVSQQAKLWQISTKSSSNQPVKDGSVDRDRLLQLEAELTLIGEIDEGLVTAHQELTDRVAYLDGQADDLEQAVTDIQKALQELDRRIATTFTTNFKKINTIFGREFERLFSGGEAKIALTKLDDDEYGIEISVRPPGKRLGLLSALSGGEKTLAAIALLTAILRVNPSPFVMLDEVDAALDDHNATLFCETLRLLARHSQILVITHNHETMVHADKLYGVTASPKRASTVVAVDLTTAEAIH
jgi:chromosome segregation protein